MIWCPYLCVDGGVGLAAVQLGRVAVAGRAVVGRGQERQRRQEDQVLQGTRILTMRKTSKKHCNNLQFNV